MVAKFNLAPKAQIRVLQCTECNSYLINVGSVERTVGAAVPSNCLSVTTEHYPCLGDYHPVAQTAARNILGQIGKAAQSGISLETDQTEAEVGEKR